jgi:Prophage tail length tape measure protein
MTDLATLYLATNSKEVVKASGDLDKMSGAAKEAHAATEKLSIANSRMEATQQSVAAATQRIAAADQRLALLKSNLVAIQNTEGVSAQKVAAAQLLVSNAEATLVGRTNALIAAKQRLAATEEVLARARGVAEAAQRRVNLGQVNSTKVVRQLAQDNRLLAFQLNDVAVSLASGMNPMMVAVQQGSQISQLYAGNGGVAMAFKQTGNMLLGMVTKFPLLTASVGVAAIGIAGLTYEINKLTSVSVSMGDVTSAVFSTLGSRISDLLLPAIQTISPTVTSVWDYIVDKTKWLGNIVINSFRAVGADIGFIFKQFPSIVGLAIGGTANLVVEGIEKMINFAVKGIDMLSEKVNVGLAAIGSERRVPIIGEITLGRVDTGKMYSDFTRANVAHKKLVDEINSSDPMGNFFNDVKEKSISNAFDRIKEKGKKAADTIKHAFEDAKASILAATQDLNFKANMMGAPKEVLTQFAKEQELVNAALKDGKKLTPELTQEIAKLASGYSMAEKAAELAEAAQKKIADGIAFAREVTGGFFNDLKSGLESGKSLWQSLGDAAVNALSKIADKLLNEVLDALFKVNGAASGAGGGGGFLSSILGALFGGFGGVSAFPAAPTIGIQSFSGGGQTPYSSPTGGIDGKGGFKAILHPNETIIDNKNKPANQNQPIMINNNYTISGAISSKDIEESLRQNNKKMIGDVERRFAGNFNRSRKSGVI